MQSWKKMEWKLVVGQIAFEGARRKNPQHGVWRSPKLHSQHFEAVDVEAIDNTFCQYSQRTCAKNLWTGFCTVTVVWSLHNTATLRALFIAASQCLNLCLALISVLSKSRWLYCALRDCLRCQAQDVLLKEKFVTSYKAWKNMRRESKKVPKWWETV